MTEPRPRKQRKPRAVPVVLTAVAAFLVVFTLLAVQMRTGHDPALGATVASTKTPAPRRVLVHRVVERRVIVTVRPAAEDDEGAPAQSAAPASAPRPPPRRRDPPRPPRPRPPHRAPAPAPVQTRSS